MNSSFENIISLANQSALPYLLIGGNCVNLYGYARTTFDLDLLINRNGREQWITFWESHSYFTAWEQGAFTRLRSDSNYAYPIDLMTVGSRTFKKFREQENIQLFNELSIPTPSPLHLIALKLHALQNESRDEENKDLLDIYGIIDSCQINVKDEDFIKTLDKYGSESIIEKIHAKFS